MWAARRAGSVSIAAMAAASGASVAVGATLMPARRRPSMTRQSPAPGYAVNRRSDVASYQNGLTVCS